MKIRFKLSSILAIVLLVSSSSAFSSTVLLTDNYDAPNGTPMNGNVSDPLSGRQSGIIATQNYTSSQTGTGGSNGIFSNQQSFGSVTTTVGILTNTVDYRFDGSTSTVYDTYTFSIDIDRNVAAAGLIKIGTVPAEASYFNPGELTIGFLIAGGSPVFRFYDGGTIVYSAASGTSGSVELTIQSSGFSTGPWDGTGSTIVSASLDGSPLDLNGASPGDDYIAAARTVNYFSTIGSHNSPSATTIFYDNLSVTAVPESSTYGLAAGILTLACALIRRRRAS